MKALIIEFQPQFVASSNVVSVGYSKKRKILLVEFKGGKKYFYFDVPEEIYRSMMLSPSKGKFHHAEVKDKYMTVRSEDCFVDDDDHIVTMDRIRIKKVPKKKPPAKPKK